MDNEKLYEIVLSALAVYVVLGLCIIGSPSLTVALWRSVRSAASFLRAGAGAIEETGHRFFAVRIQRPR